MEDNLKKNKNGRQPQQNEKMEDNLIKMRKKWKTTSKKIKWKMTSKNKMEDEPINQNQPNWL